MRHAIIQSSLYATLDISLDVGEEILADPDAVVAMSDAIELTTAAKSVPAANWWGSGGTSVAVANRPSLFRAGQDQSFLSLAPRFPGTISSLLFEAGASLYLLSTNFLAATSGLVLSTRFGGNVLGSLRRVLPLMEVTGEGELFYVGCGELVHRELTDEESLLVAARCLVGFEETVEVEWDRPPQDRPGAASPLITVRLFGPGQVIYQTRSLVR